MDRLARKKNANLTIFNICPMCGSDLQWTAIIKTLSDPSDTNEFWGMVGCCEGAG